MQEGALIVDGADSFVHVAVSAPQITHAMLSDGLNVEKGLKGARPKGNDNHKHSYILFLVKKTS